MKNPSKLIVTGGAGFIGSNFVRLALAGTEAEIRVVDKLTYAGSEHNLKEVEADSRYSFVRADIYSEEDFPGRFDAGLGAFWWSHVQRQSQGSFIQHFHRRLQAAAVVGSGSCVPSETSTWAWPFGRRTTVPSKKLMAGEPMKPATKVFCGRS